MLGSKDNFFDFLRNSAFASRTWHFLSLKDAFHDDVVTVFPGYLGDHPYCHNHDRTVQEQNLGSTGIKDMLTGTQARLADDKVP